jgi:hypothetical protein
MRTSVVGEGVQVALRNAIVDIFRAIDDQTPYRLGTDRRATTRAENAATNNSVADWMFA